jgi:hypothetical protein
LEKKRGINMKRKDRKNIQEAGRIIMEWTKILKLDGLSQEEIEKYTEDILGSMISLVEGYEDKLVLLKDSEGNSRLNEKEQKKFVIKLARAALDNKLLTDATY